MPTPLAQKFVVCGAGFLGSSITKAVTHPIAGYAVKRQVQLSSRNPQKQYDMLKGHIPDNSLLPPVTIDVTHPPTLAPAFKNASVVVSLVGTMYGSPKVFEDIQWHGAENVARAAKEAGAKLIHISAIGADKTSSIPYARTKGLGEEAVLRICPDATIIRPSLVFGPGDGFFARFAMLSTFLPFLPVFGGGQARFQPVYVGDIARAVEVASRTTDESTTRATSGKIIEAGGPEVFTYRELMQLVLKYTGRSRPILSLPFAVGTLQGLVLERLPPNILTITRAQIEQLKSDNIVNPSPPSNHASFDSLLTKFTGEPRKSVHEILPQYL